MPGGEPGIGVLVGVESGDWATGTAVGVGTGVLVGGAAVGGGVLAVDIIEHPEKGFLVNEINHTLEFHTAQPTSGVDIAGVIVDYVIDIAKGKVKKE